MEKCYINRYAKALYCYDYKGRYCQNCGLDSFDNPWLMEFHHINPEEKEYTISSKIKSAPFEQVKEELDKCALLCVHCHRKTHAEKNYKEYKENINLIMDKFQHIKNNNGVGKLKDGLWKKYSKDEIETYIKEGKTIKEISTMLDEKYYAVSAMLRKYELETESGKRIRLDNIVDSIIRDYVEFGYTIKKIMSRRKMSEDAVLKILQDNNVKMRNNNETYKPRATNIDVVELKKLLDAGFSKKKISEMLNCAEYSVYRIIKKHNL
jgi:hypothetical protein